MTTTRKTRTASTGGDREDGIVEVKGPDGRVHFTAGGSAAERDLTAKASKDKGEKDAAPAVAEG